MEPVWNTLEEVKGRANGRTGEGEFVDGVRRWMFGSLDVAMYRYLARVGDQRVRTEHRAPHACTGTWPGALALSLSRTDETWMSSSVNSVSGSWILRIASNLAHLLLGGQPPTLQTCKNPQRRKQPSFGGRGETRS
ncbi:hypothetical protein N7462_008166 [Penicillium macrosclerotiorum]|uniref:uncharacterized protein n=1 Tax=Penicillium macrosclerotiorum TaxID=303699 RepID=UPI002546F5CF|nr:uncharacterized protein N7462_008166 [Penicillium macrosclerotiorum]KAJ5679922.1 hypothetical protein N7462_008166 [Penicillium macrosclerotiorum]